MHNGRPLLVVAGSMKGSAPDGGGGNNCEFYDYTRQGSQWELCSKSNSSYLVFILFSIIDLTCFQNLSNSIYA